MNCVYSECLKVTKIGEEISAMKENNPFRKQGNKEASASQCFDMGAKERLWEGVKV